MHLFSIRTTVTPEPGVSFAVYTSYVTIARNDFDKDSALVVVDKYQAYFSKELEYMIQNDLRCQEILNSKTAKCQAGNYIEENSRLQHYKSYLLPSIAAGIAYSRGNVAEINKIKGEKDISPSASLRGAERRSGVLFFNILLWIKLLTFYLLLRSSESRGPGLIFFSSLSILSIYGLFLDVVLGRGSGSYAIDPIINNSPLFDSGNSVQNAVLESFLVATKSLIAPAPSIAIWGITPRSVAAFIALAIFISVATTSSWKMLVLVPLGLGVHFTSFVFQIAVVVAVILLSKCRPKKIEVLPLLFTVVFTAIIFVFQLTNLLDNYVLGLIYLSTLSIAYLTFLSKMGSYSYLVSLKSCLVTGLIVYFGVTALTIFYYAIRYNSIESAGFWIDGFTREASGRIASLINAFLMSIFIWQMYLALNKRCSGHLPSKLNKDDLQLYKFQYIFTIPLSFLLVAAAFPISNYLFF